MSHWKAFTNNTLKDTNMGYLEAALRTMGLGLDHSCKQISNAWGKEAVDMALTSDKNGKIALGFKLNAENVLELKGDFYCSGLNESTFINALSQKYQQIRITEAMETAGWNVEASTNAKGEVELEVSQWV